MKRLLLCALLALMTTPTIFAQDYKDKITLVIHGGAGTITRQNMTPEREKAYKEALTMALLKGHQV